MGDVEGAGEHQITRWYGQFLKCDVIKAGHHGSITSSSSDLLAYVRPRHCVISVGLRNKFHHPSAEILRRYQAIGSVTRRTDEEAAVIMESDGTTWHMVAWR